MERFRKVLEKAKRIFLAKPSVVGVGIGYKETELQKTDQMSLVVYVTKKKRQRELTPKEIIPHALDSMPTDVVEIGEIKFLSERTGKVRPAQPGISIGHHQITAGTFGAVVRDRKTGEPLILSNNHVLANSTSGKDGKAAIGDDILQPGPYDGGTAEDIIGVLHRFVPIYAEQHTAECRVAKLTEKIQNLILQVVRPAYQVQFFRTDNSENLVDCALAKPLAPRLITDEVFEIGPITGVGEMKPGMMVKKSGRTTGLTTGEIKSVATTLRVQMAMDSYALFTDQAVSDMKSQGGDSGSIVLNEDNEAVGLLFAGSDKYTIINQIQHVLELLDITF
ncbi:MAG: hypothetical protein ACOX3A_04800 [bacterium]|jgi:hypothetical protein